MIALRSHCILIGRSTPDRLLGRECHVLAAIHIVGVPSRYTVLLGNGTLIKCGEAALLPIDPLPWEWERVNRLQQTKGPMV